MSALHEGLRKQLEKAVIQAREVAEEGASAALDRLGVGRVRAYDGLSKAESDLRVKLRAKGKQLGDVRKSSGEQETQRLAGELAYEYWHRMLFARFLAENDLLMHPDAGVSVSLVDCEELAREEGLANGWLLAERWAARMLPEIFRPADPLLQVPFAPEHERALEKLLEALPAETFRASDSLGWVYQFWQARRKEEVNKSGVKIGAEELPAVTQLFTEPYMVHFLLDNTLGAWWTALHPGETPPVAFEYLRLLEDGAPAAGRFDGWPKRVAELTVLDPCCGSGHFLVAAFLRLVPLRMREEELGAREACDAVLRDNLHGLEIDPRCTQIAAFAVALAAWTFPGGGGYRLLTSVNVACSGLTPSKKREDWVSLAAGDERLERGLLRVYELFSQAPEIGSLADPSSSSQAEAFVASFADIAGLLQTALVSDSESESDVSEAAVVAQGLFRAADLLTAKYDLVITNVPYLTRQKQGDVLRRYIEQRHGNAKADLATAFIDRALRCCRPAGVVATVSPNNWTFLPAYKSFRKELLRSATWVFGIRLGPGCFTSISGEVVNVVLTALRYEAPHSQASFALADLSASSSVNAKEQALRKIPLRFSEQSEQAANPDSRILFEERSGHKLLSAIAESRTGIRTADNGRFLRCFWELPTLGATWAYQQSTVQRTSPYGGREHVLHWDGGAGDLSEYARLGLASIQGKDAWNRHGVVVSLMGNLPATLYSGDKFDMNCGVIWPKKDTDLNAIWAFCSSEEYAKAVRQIDQSLKLTTATLLKVPFDHERWTEIARANGPLPGAMSSDPTQWLFRGNAVESSGPLHVSVARLVGYRWPEQFPDGLSHQIDQDGVVCLPPVCGERAAADRLRDLLAVSYGSDWSVAKQSELLAAAGSPGATLESWLRDDFFAQHCSLFHQRPFVWHIWDGRKDGFAALVNYHKLDRHTLQTLTYTYLGDWIARQEADAKTGMAGADLRLAAARALQRKLELILEGEPPYDIFVRWKSIEQQPVGWEPDLNDGVRLNIRPFVVADVLRKKPSIKLAKDRGSNPPGSPWGEERLNSYEEYFPGKKLTNAMKLAARADATRSAGAGT